jgi:hypothetical protein
VSGCDFSEIKFDILGSKAMIAAGLISNVFPNKAVVGGQY